MGRVYSLERERLRRQGKPVPPGMFTRSELEQGCHALARAMGPLPTAEECVAERSWWAKLMALPIPMSLAVVLSVVWVLICVWMIWTILGDVEVDPYVQQHRQALEQRRADRVQMESDLREIRAGLEQIRMRAAAAPDGGAP